MALVRGARSDPSPLPPDGRGQEDLWRVHDAVSRRSSWASSADPGEAVPRGGLRTALDTGQWEPFEQEVRRHATRCARLGVPLDRLERATGRFAAELAAALGGAYGTAPRRLASALEALAQVVRREVAALRDGYGAFPILDEPATQGSQDAAPVVSVPLEALGDGVIATDDRGTVVQMNPAAERAVGWTLSEALGHRLDEVFRIVDPETGARVSSRVDEVVRDGAVRGVPSWPVLVARSGARRTVAESIAPVFGQDGAIRGTVLVFRDQASERAHGEALEVSEDRTRAILEASLDGVITLDRQGAITGLNTAAERMFGVDALGVAGSPFAERLLPVSERSRLEAVITSELVDGEGKVLAVRHAGHGLRGDGREFPVEMGLVRIPGGGSAELTCFVRDLTAAKEAEAELTRSSAQLRQLAARVQAAREEERTRIARELHDELGQQLTAFRMDLGWLSTRRGTSQEAAERLAAMSRIVDSTFELVRRLGTELRPGVLDNLGLPAALDWQGREFARRSGIQVDVVASPDLASLDRDRATTIFRIFQEILTNVGRHSEAARVVARLTRRGRSVRLVVHDNGRGIRPEEAANTTSLGLLGMRERAALHGGSVRVEAPSEGGTTVTVDIPLPPETP